MPSDDWGLTEANQAYTALLAHVKREHSRCSECDLIERTHNPIGDPDDRRVARTHLEIMAAGRRKLAEEAAG